MLELQALAQIAQIPVEVQVLHALNTASLIGENLRVESLSLSHNQHLDSPISADSPTYRTAAAAVDVGVDPRETGGPQSPQRRPVGRNLLARKDSQGLLQSPFRSQAAAARPPSAPTASRLWNPANSTLWLSPTTKQPSQRRRPSTPPPPAVPLEYPKIDITTQLIDAAGKESHHQHPPSLPPEQLQQYLSATARNSLQVEGRLSGEHRVGLPKSVRHSYDKERVPITPPPEEPWFAAPPRPHFGSRSRTSSFKERARALSFGLVRPPGTNNSSAGIDKGKGKAVVMASTEPGDHRRSASRDVERGPDVLPRHSTTLSIPDGIGSAISSSNSSIMGDPDQPDLGEEWGPQHPCFPHLNPHVPMDSADYASTRIIRVHRDWLVQGDLAPTFSNLYPEILDPAGISEQEFRRIIEKLNTELVLIFSPKNWRNIVDGVLGLLTGWVWDDLGLTNTKSRLRNLEAWIEKWNTEMEKTVGSEEGVIAPRIIPLRRTGYMNLDIQIPDPEIAPAVSQPTTSAGPAEHDAE
ncbi:hypothetical protein E8E14_005774 [Neopestalotiopsis sp. 37M]|nr:hypothetical protein E8E14_005774 [Neopestalotiopsis sp. 37M]